MPRDRSLEGTPAIRESNMAGTQVRIRWDDSNMRSSYANVYNVAGTWEEIVLLFGMNHAWQAGQRK